MYEMKSFRFWVSYYDVAQELSEKEQGMFYKAIMDYMFTGEDREDELTPIVKICFKAIKANLKRSKTETKSKNSEKPVENSHTSHDTSHAPCDVHRSDRAMNIALNSNSNININSNIKRSGEEVGKTMPPSCRASLIEMGVLREVHSQ